MMSKKTKITFTLDQPMYEEYSKDIIKAILGDKSAFGAYKSFNPENVLIEEVNAAEPRESGEKLIIKDPVIGIDQKVKDIIDSYESYIRTLYSEIEELALPATIYGWKSKRVEEGALRCKEILKAQIAYDKLHKG